MVQDGRPAYNVRNFGMFYKFLTTCATVYEVSPAIYSLVLSPSMHSLSVILAQLVTRTMCNPHSHHREPLLATRRDTRLPFAR